MMNGGYLMVSKTDTNLYEKLNNALTSGKPILWYEDENTCYYIDTITKSGTNIILTKGDKIITIENDGNIIESGDIQNHLYKLSISCTYQYSEADTNNFYFNVITDKPNITLVELFKYISKGDILINFDADVIAYFTSVDRTLNTADVRYFDAGTWTEYDNNFSDNTVTNFTITDVIQLF